MNPPLFVSKVILQNFKSFKKGEVLFEKGFNSIVGPNGSGKSNLVDAILFAFGESRLRSMRVKKIRDLIFQNSPVTDVTLVLDDNGKERKLTRALRKDGKIKYEIDGKRVKKYVLEEFLLQNRIALHNVIKQGEVQRIVELHSKDRREMIDYIASISEYEEKKKEALGELDKVQSHVSEEKAIIAEKSSFLEELEIDKKNAEKFVDFDLELKRSKATILFIDVSDLQKQFESLVNASLDLDNKIRALSDEMHAVEEKIVLKQQRKDEVNRTIVEKSGGRVAELQTEIDSLKNEIENSKSIIERDKVDLKAKQESLDSFLREKQRVVDEMSGAKKQLQGVNAELEAVQKILAEKQREYDELVSKSEAFSKDFHSARKQMSDLEEEMRAVNEQLGKIQVEVSTAEEARKLKQNELERIQAGRFEDYSEQKKLLSARVRDLGGETSKFDSQLSSFFDREKALVKLLSEADEEIITAKQKISVSETRLRMAGSSRAVDVVEKLRSEMKGVYGTVQQLIDYDTEYSVPVSAAMGQRLHYVVVDSVKTAGKAVDFLKSRNLGRLSFIPLDKIQGTAIGASEQKLKSEKGAIDFLFNLLEFDDQYEKAIKFVCGSTLVMKNFASAEPLVREIRMVTLDGELIEASGLIAGGKAASQDINPFVEAKELQKWEAALEKANGEKRAALDEIEQVRSKQGELRKSKAELEVAKARAELEFKHVSDEEKAVSEKQGNVSKAVSQLKSEIKHAGDLIDTKDEERRDLMRRISDLNIKFLSAKERVDVEKEEQFGSVVREREKRISDLRVSVSDYANQAGVKKTEISGLERQLDLYERQEKEAQREVLKYREEMDAADERIRVSRKALEEKTAEQRRISSAMEHLWEEAKAVEAEIKQLAELKGKLQYELDLKVKPNQQEIIYKRAAVEARLAELKAQYAAFEGIEPLKGKEKAELILRVKELDKEIEALGPINMRALDIFEEKTREFMQHKERLGQLETERLAVIALIEEIEGKKKATFMETYDIVNANFKKIFRQIFPGEGTLYLENPDDPFAGGLTMQVKLDNKDVKYLELMSGGEKSLLALIFLFALQGLNPSSVYILDEADAALDEENSRKLSLLLKALSRETQFIVVSHNEGVYRDADVLIGVAMAGHEGSKLVEVKLGTAQ